MRAITEIEENIKFWESEKNKVIKDLQDYGGGEDAGVEHVIARRDRIVGKISELEKQLQLAQNALEEDNIESFIDEYDELVSERNKLTGGVTEKQILEMQNKVRELKETLDDKVEEINTLVKKVGAWRDRKDEPLPLLTSRQNKEWIDQYEILNKRLDKNTYICFERLLNQRDSRHNPYIATLVVDEEDGKDIVAQAYLDEDVCKKFMESQDPKLLREIMLESDKYIEGLTTIPSKLPGRSVKQYKPNKKLDDSLSELMGDEFHVYEGEDFKAKGKFSPKNNYHYGSSPEHMGFVVSKKIIENEEYEKIIEERAAQGIDEEAYETELIGLREQEETLLKSLESKKNELDALTQTYNYKKRSNESAISDLDEQIAALGEKITRIKERIEEKQKSSVINGIEGLSNAVKPKAGVDEYYNSANSETGTSQQEQTHEIK